MNQRKSDIILPAEWHTQQAVQLTWPNEDTDWNDMLMDVIRCYQHVSKLISDRQKLLVVCRDPEKTAPLLSHCNSKNLLFTQAELNDTWARDHAFITILKNEKPVLLDFGFNGWGNKFNAEQDNRINKKIYSNRIFQNCTYEDHTDFILEGGSIESDGSGTILTTTECLLNATRNPGFSKEKIENYLKITLGDTRILWLEHGYLDGDDTDSHIDTLVRFCSKDTIAYVTCNDPADEHYRGLKDMEVQLKTFMQTNGSPYRLIPLPMVDPVFDPEDGHRLPATYANFLIINEAVLVPVYNKSTDHAALEALEKAFPKHGILPVDCSPLIRQHGSLHCITMHYPVEVDFIT